MKLDDGRLTFVAQQEVTALDAIHKAALVKAACAGRVTEGVGTCISIHAPTWGATGAVLCRFALTLFQSTHPRGVRPAAMTRYGSILSFQSTHPRGVRPAWQSDCKPMSDFNPRTHVGCDRASLLPPPGNGYFNPRTHVGCDGHQGLLLPDAAISIHAPTWGATSVVGYLSCPTMLFQSTHPRGVRPIRPYLHVPLKLISIHAPTWGATQLPEDGGDRLGFQSTHPRGVRPTARLEASTAQQFQSTHPRGVRLAMSAPDLRLRVFQSTHPRGVRPHTPETSSSRRNFNPRTHVGCDPSRLEIRGSLWISIHAPTWGATTYAGDLVLSTEFQSTHPRGVRLAPLRTLDNARRISIHAPTWGATCERAGKRARKEFQSTHPRGVRLLFMRDR